MYLAAMGRLGEAISEARRAQTLVNPSFPQGFNTLDINMVNAGLLNRGDMHWDLSNTQYEVPKGSGRHGMFCSG